MRRGGQPTFPSVPKVLGDHQQRIRKLEFRPGPHRPRVKLMGKVLGGGNVPLGAGKAFVAHGGFAIRLNAALAAGDTIHVDYGHVAPFDELHAALHPVTGWTLDQVVEEPWEQRPWNGSTGLVFFTPFGSPKTLSPIAFTGIIGLSACSDLSGDVITWTSPVAAAEADGIDTTNGHFGWLLHDLGPAVTSGSTNFTVTHTPTTNGAFAVHGNQYREGLAALAVGAELASGSSSENAVGLVLPSDLDAGTFLLVTSACEKDQLPLENSSTLLPQIHLNWGVEEL